MSALSLCTSCCVLVVASGDVGTVVPHDQVRGRHEDGCMCCITLSLALSLHSSPCIVVVVSESSGGGQHQNRCTRAGGPDSARWRSHDQARGWHKVGGPDGARRHENGCMRMARMDGTRECV